MSGNIPRPEYPRPDRLRWDWINLNGYWRFCFDDYELGEKEKWFLDIDRLDEKILVPFPFQSKLSGIHDECFHDIVWYAKEFKIPEKFLDKRIFLNFGAIDYISKIWFNGRLVGQHIGGYDPISLEVSDLVKEKNIVVVEAIDRHGDQPRGKQDSRLHPCGCRYMRVTGIWQTVWIDVVGKTFIKNFYVTPDIDNGKILLNVNIDGDILNKLLEVRVFFNSSEIFSQKFDISSNTMMLSIPISYLKLWTPETPDLYKIRLSIMGDGNTIDMVEGYFGMRKISISRDKILLNNKPIYLKMALDQGYFIDGIYTAPSDEDLRRDVEYAKQLGLNGVRKHQKPEDPRYFYWCDKIGLLVWEEMSDWGMSLKTENLEMFWSQLRNIILRDFNHPSIIVWVPFNERNIYDDIMGQKFVLEIYRRIKNLDKTRLVVDNSGYMHTETDIVDIHDYSGWLGGMQIKKLWDKYRKEGGIPPSPHRPLIAKGFKYKGRPIVISEMGGWGIKKYMPIVKRPPAYYGNILEDEYEFLSKYRDVVLTFGEYDEISGFCYTQLYDVEGEVNGYLTYDRRWKIDPYKVREIHEKMGR